MPLTLVDGGEAASTYLFLVMVLWPQALIAGAVLGGWLGSRNGQQLDGPGLLRVIVTAGVVTSGYLFVNVYLIAR